MHRAALAALLALPATASATVYFYDASGFSWDVDDLYNGYVYDGTNDAYDGFPGLCVLASTTFTSSCSSTDVWYGDGVAGTLELSGEQVALDPDTIQGLTVQRKVYVPSTGTHGFARFMEVLTNPGTSAVTVQVVVGFNTYSYANLGSDGGTIVEDTSDGTGSISTALTWFTTSDMGYGYSYDPPLSHVLRGEGAEVSLHGLAFYSTDMPYWSYVVTVDPGDTAVVLHFQAMNDTVAEAMTTAEWLVELPDEALTGMTEDELDAVVNWDVDYTPAVDEDEDGFGADEDCDDADPDIYPGAAEICNEHDDDCDGDIDEDATDAWAWYEDLDGDTFGDDATLTFACDEPEGFVLDGGDCDDLDEDAYPGAVETWYDGVDSDCDGADDYDQDGDGVLAIVGGGLDCDDTDADVWPGARDTWYDGVDSDCDGADDYDQDGDGADLFTDCDDTDEDFHPGAREACDGIDHDCDGLADDDDEDASGRETYFRDRDRDGFGDADTTRMACDELDGWVSDDTDCDDRDPDVYPDADDAWYDSVDADCEGDSDFDQDRDGFESADYGGDDCDDTTASISPTVAEVWYDGVDSDCSGGSDYDQDGDGFDSADEASGPDCDDADASVSPVAAEVWYDGVDQDCDGNDDDQDGDGVPQATDCDDTDPAVYPNAEGYDELCEPIAKGGCSTLPSSPVGLLGLALGALMLRRRRG